MHNIFLIVSRFMPYAILIWGVYSIIKYFILSKKFESVQMNISGFLANIIKTLPSTPDTDNSQELNHKIDSFLNAIKDTLQNITNLKKETVDIIKAKFEAKTEVTSHLKDLYSLQWQYNVLRSFIEIFPLLGIIGTVAAIGAGLSNNEIDEAEKIKLIVKNFGESLWATGLGLLFAIINILLNSLFETKFEKVLGFGKVIDDVAREAKKAILAFPNKG